MAMTHVNIVYIIISLRLLTATSTLLHSDSNLETMLRISRELFWLQLQTTVCFPV